MRFAIAYSKKDSAGKNIVEQLKLIGFLPQMPIIELPHESIYSEDISVKKYPELKNIDFLIFATKHQSETKEPSLCLHAPGNWRGADFGGKNGKICKTSGLILKFLFQELNKNSVGLKNYKVSLECTHHGPLIDISCCFIELGSSEKQWEDKEAAKVIAKTIFSLQNFKINKTLIPCIGIGGPHYCPNFNKIQLESKYALSHIIPQYVFPITEPMLKEAEEKSEGQIKEIVLDWKGCGNSEERQALCDLLDKWGFKYKRAKDIRK